MSIIIRLQNLPLTAKASDIREFFGDLKIPKGAVNIVGGPMGDAFIGFASDEDARLAMRFDRKLLHNSTIRLLLSSRREMDSVISNAHAMAAASVFTNSATSIAAGAGADKPPTVDSAKNGVAAASQPIDFAATMPKHPSLMPVQLTPPKPINELMNINSSWLANFNVEAKSQTAEKSATGSLAPSTSANDSSAAMSAFLKLFPFQTRAQQPQHQPQTQPPPTSVFHSHSSSSFSTANIDGGYMAAGHTPFTQTPSIQQHQTSQQQSPPMGFQSPAGPATIAPNMGESWKSGVYGRDAIQKFPVQQQQSSQAQSTHRIDGGYAPQQGAGKAALFGGASVVDESAIPPQQPSYQRYPPPAKSAARPPHIQQHHQHVGPPSGRLNGTNISSTTTGFNAQPSSLIQHNNFFTLPTSGGPGRGPMSGPPPQLPTHSQLDFTPREHSYEQLFETSPARSEPMDYSQPPPSLTTSPQPLLDLPKALSIDADVRQAIAGLTHAPSPASSRGPAVSVATSQMPPSLASLTVSLPAPIGDCAPSYVGSFAGTTNATAAASAVEAAAAAVAGPLRATNVPDQNIFNFVKSGDGALIGEMAESVAKNPKTTDAVESISPTTATTAAAAAAIATPKSDAATSASKLSPTTATILSTTTTTTTNSISSAAVASSAPAAAPADCDELYVELTRVNAELLRPAALEKFLAPSVPLTLSSVKVVFDKNEQPQYALVKFGCVEDARRVLNRNGEKGIRIRSSSKREFDEAIDGDSLATGVSSTSGIRRRTRGGRKRRGGTGRRSRSRSRTRSRSPIRAGGGTLPSDEKRRRTRSISLSPKRDGCSGPLRICLQLSNVPFRAEYRDVDDFVRSTGAKYEHIQQVFRERQDYSDRWIVEVSSNRDMRSLRRYRGTIFRRNIDVDLISVKEAEAAYAVPVPPAPYIRQRDATPPAAAAARNEAVGLGGDATTSRRSTDRGERDRGRDHRERVDQGAIGSGFGSSSTFGGGAGFSRQPPTTLSSVLNEKVFTQIGSTSTVSISNTGGGGGGGPQRRRSSNSNANVNSNNGVPPKITLEAKTEEELITRGDLPPAAFGAFSSPSVGPTSRIGGPSFYQHHYHQHHQHHPSNQGQLPFNHQNNNNNNNGRFGSPGDFHGNRRPPFNARQPFYGGSPMMMGGPGGPGGLMGGPCGPMGFGGSMSGPTGSMGTSGSMGSQFSMPMGFGGGGGPTRAPGGPIGPAGSTPSANSRYGGGGGRAQRTTLMPMAQQQQQQPPQQMGAGVPNMM